MSALTFTSLTFNTIKEACQKKEYYHYKTAEKLIHAKMHSQDTRTSSIWSFSTPYIWSCYREAILV